MFHVVMEMIAHSEALNEMLGPVSESDRIDVQTMECVLVPTLAAVVSYLAPAPGFLQ